MSASPPTPQRVSNPIFARLYARVARDSETRGAAEHRRRMLAGCRGRVIEIGAGLGSNFAHYPPQVTEVVALEPEPHLRGHAMREASRAPVRVSVIDGHAGNVPFADGEFDAGVASLVLCTVPDQRLRARRSVTKIDCGLLEAPVELIVTFPEYVATASPVGLAETLRFAGIVPLPGLTDSQLPPDWVLAVAAEAQRASSAAADRERLSSGRRPTVLIRETHCGWANS